MEATIGRNTRVIMMGAGTLGREWLPEVRALPWCQVTGFVDNDPAKQGRSLDSLPVERPTRDLLAQADVILITSMYRRDLLIQLHGFGLADRAALSPADLKRRFGGIHTAIADSTLSCGRWKRAAREFPPAVVGNLPAPAQPLQEMIPFTICTNRMLPQAWALANSFLRHYPTSRFHLFLADRKQPGLVYPETLDPRIVTEEAAALDLPDFDYLTLAYDAFELCCALKPLIARKLLHRHPKMTILYFDSDILVTGQLGRVLEQASGGSWVLTPHRLSPASSAEEEIGFLRCGTLNLGFFAFSDGPETRQVLDWWADRLKRHCLRRPQESLFVDQKWMDLAIPFHGKARILIDPGCNVGYWNLDERPLAVGPRGYTAKGTPLRFFHFSGYDPAQPFSLTQHRPDASPVSGPVASLLASYLASVAAVDSQDLPCVHTYGIRQGRDLPDSWRAAFRDWAGASGESADFGAFLNWMRSPAQIGSPFPRAFEIGASSMIDLAGFQDRHREQALDFLMHVDAVMRDQELSSWLPEAIDGTRLAETLVEGS